MNDVFDTAVRFADFDFHDALLRGLDEAEFVHPTHIQAKLIPVALDGRDVLGQAKTGTGKTAAFGLPIIQQADARPTVQALVLAPTRELAQQICTELNELGRHTDIRAASIIGGQRFKSQLDALRQGKAQIVVGTPGRVMDLHRRGDLKFNDLRWAVLDEVDRMLDIGFREDIRRILGAIQQPHQTIFVSATISDEIERLARRYMKDDVERISTVAESLTVSQVTQNYVPVKPWDKMRMLRHLLTHEDAALTVVFCRTKRKVSKLARYLKQKNIEAFEIHGDLPQSKRNRIIERLRAGKLEVLVASDLASRGLDVGGITHIINFDLPDDPEVYVHRIGRTARAGRRGTAWSFVEPDQGQLLTEIEKLTSAHIEKLQYADFEESPQPDDWTPEPKGGRRAPDPPRVDPRKSRFDESFHASEGEQVDESKFPGGIAPKGPPRKTLGSRFRTRRGR